MAMAKTLPASGARTASSANMHTLVSSQARSSSASPPRDWTPGPDRASPCVIPDSIVTRSVRYNYDSDLLTFLRSVIDPVVLEGLIDDYRIGVTKSRATIFFQIDVQGRCRTGKIMMYDPQTGHRIKDPDVPGRVTWVHSMMKRAGMLPADWVLRQCLFGEHLLPLYPDKPVGLVESEKTAVIAAGLMPRYLWLATGGKSGLNERLNVLRGRKVVAWPDVDGFQEWTEKLAGFTELDITVSPLLQQVASPEDFAEHIDIADWLIREKSVMPGSDRASHSASFLRSARFLSPEAMDAVEGLIDDLELEFFGAEKVIEETSDEVPE